MNESEFQLDDRVKIHNGTERGVVEEIHTQKDDNNTIVSRTYGVRLDSDSMLRRYSSVDLTLLPAEDTKFTPGDRVSITYDSYLSPGEGRVVSYKKTECGDVYEVVADDDTDGPYYYFPDMLELIEADADNPSEPDMVERPNHYTAGMPEGVEVIDIINAQGAGYMHGNVIKYMLRWKFKNGLEDLKKARVYLNWLIEQEEQK